MSFDRIRGGITRVSEVLHGRPGFSSAHPLRREAGEGKFDVLDRTKAIADVRARWSGFTAGHCIGEYDVPLQIKRDPEGGYVVTCDEKYPAGSERAIIAEEIINSAMRHLNPPRRRSRPMPR